MIGTRVKLKPSHARWHLNHPEVYFWGDAENEDPDYEEETLLHLVCCLGEPVYGRVIAKGTDCWLVSFRVGSISATYYIGRRHFDIPTNTAEVAK